jgi:uncharacterized protein (TIGR02246 family)
MSRSKLARWSAAAALLVCAGASAKGSETSQIVARTQLYAETLQKMDAEAAAGFYLADAQVAVTGGKPIQGRDAIKGHLQDSAGYQILSSVMTADKIAVKGPAATVDGTYTQQVRTPKGKEFTSHGNYQADWAKDTDGVWRIRSMVATPGH